MDGEKELKLAGTRTQAWPEAGPTLQPCSSPGPKVTSLCHIFTPFGAPPGISGCPNSKCWQEGWSSPAQVTHPLRAPKLRPRWQGLRGWGGAAGQTTRGAGRQFSGKGVKLGKWCRRCPSTHVTAAGGKRKPGSSYNQGVEDLFCPSVKEGSRAQRGQRSTRSHAAPAEVRPCLSKRREGASFSPELGEASRPPPAPQEATRRCL